MSSLSRKGDRGTSGRCLSYSRPQSPAKYLPQVTFCVALHVAPCPERPGRRDLDCLVVTVGGTASRTLSQAQQDPGTATDHTPGTSAANTASRGQLWGSMWDVPFTSEATRAGHLTLLHVVPHPGRRRVPTSQGGCGPQMRRWLSSAGHRAGMWQSQS